MSTSHREDKGAGSTWQTSPEKNMQHKDRRLTPTSCVVYLNTRSKYKQLSELFIGKENNRNCKKYENTTEEKEVAVQHTNQ